MSPVLGTFAGVSARGFAPWLTPVSADAHVLIATQTVGAGGVAVGAADGDGAALGDDDEPDGDAVAAPPQAAMASVMAAVATASWARDR